MSEESPSEIYNVKYCTGDTVADVRIILKGTVKHLEIR
jgi:hypothetical protein